MLVINFQTLKMSGNWGYLIKRPSGQQSVKAFKEQMQIGSAATNTRQTKG
jgi:hypothetical protein